ncbi:MAG: hypothetical protein DRO99_00200 [Candidatus Aenigmatarchaeota archaeon]|nr:MAG: hypothetical protein DRO99_00200 [Candidatus Aenigmarchaeota archaeon]
MDKDIVTQLLRDILDDRGVPKNIKESLEGIIGILDAKVSDNEKASQIISILDDAANDPNISFSARTLIWNTVSAMEGM